MTVSDGRARKSSVSSTNGSTCDHRSSLRETEPPTAIEVRMSVGKTPRSRNPSLNEPFGCAPSQLPHPRRPRGRLARHEGVNPGRDHEHHEDDVERVPGCPLFLRARAQKEREYDDRRDRDRRAGSEGRRVAAPALAGCEEDRAQDLRAGDHHERQRDDLREGCVRSTPPAIGALWSWLMVSSGRSSSRHATYAPAGASSAKMADVPAGAIRTGLGTQSSVWISSAVAKPSVVITPASLPPCSKASGIIVSESIVRIAPAAKVRTNATTFGDECWKRP